MQQASNGSSTSVWMSTTDVPSFPRLEGDIETDICVIGAGIGGLSSAYLLAKEGKKVVLVDAFGIGAGETGRTTAHFFPPDEWYVGVEKAFGKERAKLVADSFARATKLVESIIRNENIDCEFERLDGYLYALPGNEFKDLRKEYEAAMRCGVEVELMPRVPGLSFDTGECIRYKHQAQFHPLKYLGGLAEAFVRLGGSIYCDTRALQIDANGDRQIITTPNGKITCAAVIVATHTPFNDRVVMHTKQAGYRTYVVGIRIPKGRVPRILLWDTGDPYYYIRVETPDPNADTEVLVVGGADHKVGQDEHPEHRYAELERWARERFPMAQDVRYRWSGEIMEPADGAAYLGVNPKDSANVYIITGDSGNGMTHCTIGAMLISDLINGRENPWASIYDPARKITHGLSEFLAEQANTLSQYRDWATRGEMEAPHEVGIGQAAIVQEGMRKLAVYRDDQGELHVVSAKCTHLGCVVHWNSSEKSWDCPCHGSRFGVEGEVLHGPAAAPLERIQQRFDGPTPSGSTGTHSSVRPPQA